MLYLYLYPLVLIYNEIAAPPKGVEQLPQYSSFTWYQTRVPVFRCTPCCRRRLRRSLPPPSPMASAHSAAASASSPAGAPVAPSSPFLASPHSPRLGGSRRCPPKAICRAGRAGRSRAGRTCPSHRSPLVAPRPRPSPSRRYPLAALHRPPTGRLPNPTEPLRPTMALPRPTLRGTAPLHQPTAPHHRRLLPGRCLRRHR